MEMYVAWSCRIKWDCQKYNYIKKVLFFLEREREEDKFLCVIIVD